MLQVPTDEMIGLAVQVGYIFWATKPKPPPSTPCNDAKSVQSCASKPKSPHEKHEMKAWLNYKAFWLLNGSPKLPNSGTKRCGNFSTHPTIWGGSPTWYRD